MGEDETFSSEVKAAPLRMLQQQQPTSSIPGSRASLRRRRRRVLIGSERHRRRRGEGCGTAVLRLDAAQERTKLSPYQDYLSEKDFNEK